MAVYMEFPGVDYVEKDFDKGARAIQGIATDIAGMIILAQKGPLNVPTYVTSAEKAFEIFGSYVNYAYGAYAIDGFFKNGGRELWIVRVAHYADINDQDTCMAKLAVSDAVMNRAESPDTALHIDALYHGSDGNKIGVKIVDNPLVQTVLKEAATNGATVVTLNSMRNVEVGQVFTFSANDGAVVEHGVVIGVDYVTKTVTLKDPLANAFPIDALVRSNEFDLEVWYKTATGLARKEAWKELNMTEGHKKYAPTVVNADAGSKYIRITDLVSSDDPYEVLPAITPEKGVFMLSGGDDGLDGLTELDFIGSKAGKTGLYAFDKYDGMIQICCPETDSMAMTRAGFDYCESRGDAVFVGYVPAGLNPDSAATFRDEAGWNTSYGALYYNHGYVTDPIGIGDAPEKLVPLSGHILGCWARNDKENGYGTAPAGESMNLLGVNRLEFQVDKTNGAVLYGNRNRNINPIVSLSGNGGIVIWGSRTQSSDSRWYQIMTRRIFIYVEQSVVRGTRWATFKNKNNYLYNNIVRVVKAFLTKTEGLAGETADERFAIVCNDTINDPKDPYVITRIGLNIEGIGEFIFFEIGQTPEGVSLEEL